jgi:DNA polymerase-3 subunit epsilon
MNLKCSARGPSLDTLTEALGIEDLRAKNYGLHGADIDATQTVSVIEVFRHIAGYT